MFQHSQFEAPEDPEGTWTFDESKQLIRRRKVPSQDSIGDLKVTYEVINGFSADGQLEVSAAGRQYTDKRTGTVRLEKHPELETTLVRGKMAKFDLVKKYMNK